MAKLRSVDTHFWNDAYIVELDPIEKLLFLYLLTNPASGLAGCYERALRQIAFDTGIDREMVCKLFERFTKDGKLIYREGWVVLLNFLKHQNYNANMGIAAQKELNLAPQWVTDVLRDHCRTVPEWFPKDNRTVKGIEVNRSEGEVNGMPPLKEIFIGKAKTLLTKLLGLKTLPSFRDWEIEMVWAFQNDFTPEAFVECYQLLQQQAWRKGKGIAPKEISKYLPKLAELRSEIKSQTNGSGSGASPETPRKRAKDFHAEADAIAAADRD